VSKDLSNLKDIDDSNYEISKDAPFAAGQDVPFSFIVRCFEVISQIKGENSKNHQVEVLSRMFKSILKLNSLQLNMAYYFCVNKIGPDYETEELGLGKENLKKSIQKACGISETTIRQLLQKEGDLGLVASKSKNSQATLGGFFQNKKEKTPLTLLKVFETLQKLSTTRGQNSSSEKEGMIMKLIFDS